MNSVYIVYIIYSCTKVCRVKYKSFALILHAELSGFYHLADADVSNFSCLSTDDYHYISPFDLNSRYLLIESIVRFPGLDKTV
jgi:hypothetical protein